MLVPLIKQWHFWQFNFFLDFLFHRMECPVIHKVSNHDTTGEGDKCPVSHNKSNPGPSSTEDINEGIVGKGLDNVIFLSCLFFLSTKSLGKIPNSSTPEQRFVLHLCNRTTLISGHFFANKKTQSSMLTRILHSKNSDAWKEWWPWFPTSMKKVLRWREVTMRISRPKSLNWILIRWFFKLFFSSMNT